MKNPILYYAIAKYSTVFINVILNAVLSRVLSPDDYGVVAIVTVLTNLFTIISDMGIGNGVIQNKNLDKTEIDDIFSVSVMWAGLIGSIFWCLAEPMALFFSDMRLVTVIKLLTISVVLNAANVVPNALIMKQKMFDTAAKRMIGAVLGGGIVAVTVACMGWGYYALICQSIVTIMIHFTCNVKKSRLRFYLKFNFDGIKKIFSYSIYQFAYSLILNISQNLDNFLTGKFIGSRQLAFYNKSYMLMRYPIDYIPHAVSPIIHPMLAEHQEDKKYLYNKYVELVKFLSILGVLITVISFWNAKEIVLFLFGKNWMESVGIFKIFAIGIWAQLINAIAGSLYLSSNNTKMMLYSGMIHIPLSILAIIVGIKIKKTDILALLLVISWMIKFFVESYWLVKRSMHQSLKLYYSLFIPELIFMIFVNWLLYISIKLISSQVYLYFIIKNIIILITFICWLFLFKQSFYINCFIYKIRRK